MVDNINEFQRPVEQQRMVGQRSAIRYFDPESNEDVQRLLTTVQSPRVMAWMDEVEGLGTEDIRRWIAEKGQGKESECLFAISGSANYVSAGEVGEVQAFVNSYPVEGELLTRMVEKNYVSQSELPVVEISYAKNPGSRPGQVESGLVQVCFELNQMVGGNDKGVSPSLQIVAFVDPENVNSIKVLDNSGFECVGEIQYSNEEPKMDRVFRLNWEKAQTMLHQRADGEILNGF